MNKKKNGVLGTVRGFVERVTQDHVAAYAAQSAYFLILSFIPLILCITTIVRYITPLTEDMVMLAILEVCPANLEPFIRGIINEVYAKSGAVIPLTAVTALWSAGKALQSMINGLNTIYHVKETRNWFITRARSVFYTLALVAALLLSLTLLVFGNNLQKSLEKYIPFLSRFIWNIMTTRTFLVFGVLVFVFLFLYKMLPNRKATVKSQLPGAILTSLAWMAFSYGFSLYFSYFPSFSNMYGSLTTIVLIMLWLYVCMTIVFYGAETNAYFEKQFRQAHAFAMDLLEREDSTTGDLHERLEEYFEDEEQRD